MRTSPSSSQAIRPSGHQARSHRFWRSLSATLLATVCLARTVDAQGAPDQTPPTREDFLFHIYVDPMRGDNAQASLLNPLTTNVPPGPPLPANYPMRPLDYHPEPAYFDTLQNAWVWPIGGYLQHAPYPFRTLTGQNGALAWINAWVEGGNPVVFPWDHPDTEVPRRVTGIVIHLMPGLYGPTGVPGQPDIDAESGIPFNGEVWPAVIREFVSLQGTSSLDTILDARYQATHILEINDPLATLNNARYRTTFIDSLTIRRARVSEEPQRGEGAGIYVHSRGPNESATDSCRIWITNNFIVDNVVGIGLDSYTNGSTGVAQRVALVNNTLAWNGTGLWAGELDPAFTQNLPSIHAPLIVNNIFDSGSPTLAYIAGISGFEGVHPEDRQVDTRGGVQVGAPGVGLDFNAWEGARDPNPPNARLFVNLQVAIAPNWPATVVNSTVPDLDPRVDLTAITQGPGGRSGSLYVNDIFRRSPVGGAGVEHSHHDFRLSPNVSEDANAPGTQSPPLLNPLVNQGIDGTEDGFPIVMVNGRTIEAPGPGLPEDAEESPVHGWDWDADGFGNPRIETRSGFPANEPGTEGYFGNIDIGADEMGELLMAGYTPSTRIYTDYLIPNASAATDHSRVYFFNLIPGSPYPRPVHNAVVGQAYPWYSHVQGAPDAATGTNFTAVPVPTTASRHLLIGVLGYPIIPRALECDFSPSLPVDVHPYWPLLQLPPLATLDYYAANPWHSRFAVTAPFASTRDNPALFHNVGGSAHRGIAGTFGYYFTGVTEATLNPPGTFPLGGQYIVAGGGIFGPYAPCPPPGSCPTPPSACVYTVGVWGYGDNASGCPDLIPIVAPNPSWGVRMNCELGPGFSNLQTFLVIASHSEPDFQNLESQRRARLARQPDRREIEDLIRASNERIVR